MMLIVTGVGFLIHLYATSYMAEDKGYARFFAYLNLFIFSMLVLILGDNLPLLFVGWEGVGLCSYLLIGFWYENAANAAAGKKAFIANRIGDFGLLCAMFLLAHYTGALDWNGIANGATQPRAPGRAAPRPRLAARRRAVHRASCTSCSRQAPSPSAPRRPSASRSSSAARARARRSRSTSGSPTRWPAPRRSRRSSTRPPWSRPASTSSAGSRSCSSSRRSR